MKQLEKTQNHIVRAEYPIIVNWVEEGSSVIDLGCGDGSLMEMLEKKDCVCVGLDKSRDCVLSCENKGLHSVWELIDTIFPNIQENTYDYAICNATLMMVNNPDILLIEMQRISKYQIISFSNFANYKNRLEMFFKGVMPKHMLYGYEWYNTGHTHQLSVKDFEGFVKDRKILKKCFLSRPKGRGWLIDMFPNLFSNVAIYLLK